MSEVKEITVNVDEYLALDKYEVDEESAHIELVDDPDIEEFLKLVRVCPAALYKIDEDGKKSFDYAGCLECGTCRIACGDTIVKKWENPPAHDGRGVPLRVRNRTRSGRRSPQSGAPEGSGVQRRRGPQVGIGKIEELQFMERYLREGCLNISAICADSMPCATTRFAPGSCATW